MILSISSTLYLSPVPQVEGLNASRREVIRSVTEYALANIKLKRRISEMKQLQILMWVWGYEKGAIKGHVYDEVTTTMHYWKKRDRITLYVFSSGMIAAQQLLLCCTNHGNCLPVCAWRWGSNLAALQYASLIPIAYHRVL